MSISRAPLRAPTTQPEGGRPNPGGKEANSGASGPDRTASEATQAAATSAVAAATSAVAAATSAVAAATSAAAAASTHAPDSAAPTIDPDVLLSQTERRAWRAFLTTHARLTRRLELELLARSGVPLAELDVLFQLDQADGQRLRMNELADRVVLSRAGITRLVDRLVADGLVSREKCPSDARGSFAVLTGAGSKRLDDAMPNHLSDVKLYFLNSFSDEELERLGELLDRRFPLD